MKQEREKEKQKTMSESLLRTPETTTPKSNLSVNTTPDVKTMNLNEYNKVVDEEETLRREREKELWDQSRLTNPDSKIN